VRWGIVGSGLICSDFVQALRSAKGCAVTAVGARRIESARKFADANGIKLAFGSYDELVACSDVDIVYIGTIHPTHKKLAIMAMRAGKHVLCEKPMTICKADTAELFAVAEECGVLLVEALWTRFFPTVAKAREIIASGAIGEVLQFQGDFGFRFDGVDSDPTHRLTDPAQAGGASLDIGVYPISCMLLALGTETPSKIAAAGTLTPSVRLAPPYWHACEHSCCARCGRFAVTQPVSLRRA
jgi:predicted dehydrogenase